MNNKTIYTHNEAADLVELFEDILIGYKICVPSYEDDERDPEDMVGLYGSTYYDLLDGVEACVIDYIDTVHKGGARSDVFSKDIVDLFDELIADCRIKLPPREWGPYGFLAPELKSLYESVQSYLEDLQERAKHAEDFVYYVFE